jgi:hypothetical protein
MPDIVGQHNCVQVITPVVILPVESFEDSLDPQRLNRVANFQVLQALIDTGADVTSITEKAAKKLKLQPSGIVGVQGFGGPKYHNSYIFKIGFVDLRQDELGYQNPEFHLIDKEIEGPEFDCGDADFDVLLGMDILSIGTLTVTHTGNFKFSYRAPRSQ